MSDNVSQTSQRNSLTAAPCIAPAGFEPAPHGSKGRRPAVGLRGINRTVNSANDRVTPVTEEAEVVVMQSLTIQRMDDPKAAETRPASSRFTEGLSRYVPRLPDFSTDFRVNGRDISCVTLSTSKLTHRPAGECPCCGEPLYRCVACSADYCPVCAEVDCATGDDVKHLCNCHDEEE